MAARVRSEALERLQHDRDTVLESCTSMVNEALGDLASEERHYFYNLLRLNVYARSSEPLVIAGVFMDLQGEAESGSSSRKLSLLSV